MKRAALGVLLISLVAGPAAFAGTVLPPALHNGGNDRGGHEQHRPDNRNDNWGGRHDNDHRNDRGNNWNRGNDHRFDGRRDDHRWDSGRYDHRGDNDRRWNDNNRHYDGRFDNHRWVNPPRYVSPPRYYSQPRYDYRRENGRWHWGTYYRPYGYSQRYWRRGDRLPVEYYGSSYIIGNYYDCGLRAPPYGYHWVRVDHDVVLAAIATGVVLDVIYNQFW
jgi:Ni/Co efflux regulator RcnB